MEAIAAPYGKIDERLETLSAATGYGLYNSIKWGIADILEDAFRLPRTPSSAPPARTTSLNG